MIGAGIFALTLSGIFLAPGLLGFPGADLSPKLVFFGLAVPFGVGGWSLVWAEKRVRAEAVPLLDEFPQKAFEPQKAEQAPAVAK